MEVKMLKRNAVLFLFSVFIFPNVVIAQSVKMEPKLCAMFKNGIGLFLKEGVVPAKSGSFVLENIPSPSHGTLWFVTYDDDTLVEEAVAFRDDLKKDAETVAEMVQANVGKNVRVRYGEQIYEGTLKSVILAKTDGSYYQTGGLVNIATKSGLVSMRLDQIYLIEILGESQKTFTQKEGAKKIRVKIKSSKPETKLGMSYLSKGVMWAPSYLVDVTDTKKAKLMMSATVLNEVEDFKVVDLYFVVGFPHFVFQDVTSPLSLDGTLASFLSSIISPPTSYSTTGTTMNVATQAIVDYERRPELTSEEPAYMTGVPALSGQQTEDLFFYEKKNVTLNKGDRAHYSVFSADVDYKHVYEWRVTSTPISSDYYQSSQSTDKSEEVWHSLKLTNSTNYPWTSGAAMTVSEMKPLGQDVLKYTPKGGTINLRITLAPDIKVSKEENEKERKRDAMRLYGYTYDLVTVEGKLKLKNFKKQQVSMDIEKTVTGEVAQNGGGKVEKLATALKAINPTSFIQWEFPLKAGEEKTITYTYTIYVRQ